MPRTLQHIALLSVSLLCPLLTPCTAAQACSPSSFSFPTLFGAEFTSIQAATVQGYNTFSRWSPEAQRIRPDGLNFCNVTISYIHPGQNDLTNVQVWLPLTEWNERFMGVGGGGYATGLLDDDPISVAVFGGYAASTTDGGHDHRQQFRAPWALVSPGNINFPLLFNYAAIALNDMTVIGKSITQQYYGKPPKFSYWNGCSTGGRQGLMVAQRYPEAYDGILANCPAINLPSLAVGGYWPQLVMNQLGHYPQPCELEAIQTAALGACDDLDGVKDGIIAAPDQCVFDPQQMVGQSIDCGGAERNISVEATKVASTTWEGAKSPDGKRIWFGSPIGTPLIGPIALANTICTEEGCVGLPMPIAEDWIRLFLKKDPGFNLKLMSFGDYERLMHVSKQQYDSILGTNDPDLSEFRNAGRKMITWHGINDQLLTVRSTRQYYEQVLIKDAKATDFYRYFEVPGVGHCGGGSGAYPLHAIDALRRWVEEGIAPDSLDGFGLSVDEDGKVKHQPLCPFPLVAMYTGDDPTVVSSFSCAEGFAKKHNSNWRDEL